LVFFFVNVFYVTAKCKFGAKTLPALFTAKLFDLFVNCLDVVLQVQFLGEVGRADATDVVLAVFSLKLGYVHGVI
jgi:hypothetical protein